MPDSEFQLIARHLCRLGAVRDDVVLGPGDDAALLDPGPAPLAVAHATADARGDPEAVAHECLDHTLAVLAAAHARPAWATLALSLSTADEAWLQAFAHALDVACRHAGVSVVGGDTTRGTQAVTLFVTGLVISPRPVRAT